MTETWWYFGYRCEIGDSVVPDHFVGFVYAPRWHPVRVEGLGDLVVFMIHGEWIVSSDANHSFCDALLSVIASAYMLRRMQDEWDKLSPYEREYQIW